MIPSSILYDRQLLNNRSVEMGFRFGQPGLALPVFQVLQVPSVGIVSVGGQACCMAFSLEDWSKLETGSWSK
jgi:hypothetical protein